MKSKIIVLSILILLTACSKSADPAPPPPPVTNTTRPVVWFYGDSMTAGYGASVPGNRWTTKLCAKKNWTENNEGTAGETLILASEVTGFTSFFAKYQSEIKTRPTDSKYIFIAYGVNDCAFNFADFTPELFSTQLQTIITFANGKGWANKNIVVLCGYFENSNTWQRSYAGLTFDSAATMTRYYSFIAAAQTVAENNAGVYFVNPFNEYDITGLADGIHANDAGHLAIADYVASLVP